MMHTLWNFQLLLVSPSIRSNRDHFLQADFSLLTGSEKMVFYRRTARPGVVTLFNTLMSFLRNPAGTSPIILHL